MTAPADDLATVFIIAFMCGIAVQCLLTKFFEQCDAARTAQETMTDDLAAVEFKL